FYTIKFDTQKFAAAEKISIQEAARMLRYAWFEEVKKENGYQYILTAHHADDNIETVTLNFFRGTGIKGLRGIESSHDKIVRPLLFARGAELKDYQLGHQLRYVTDSSNVKDEYSRNFFRHQVIPLVEQVYPGAQQNVLSNISRFREVAQLYGEAVAFHKKKLLEAKGDEVHISVRKLEKLPSLSSVLYEIIADFNFSAAQTGEAMALLKSETGKYISSSSHRIIRNRNWLVIAPVSVEEAETIVIDGPGNCAWSMGQLNIEQVPNLGTTLSTAKDIASIDAAFVTFPLLLRKWKQGDYFYPMGMQKKKKLSRFFIDQKLSKTDKEKVWVLEMQKKIIWIIGHRIDDRFKVTPGTKDILQIKMRSRQT
ncbi:MAG: tRNA lysidine(34) synthetase TilS, partial [Chitinophagaceae bacterium]